MSLPFFFDHRVPRGVTDALEAAGHQGFLLKDHLDAESSDPTVIAKSSQEVFVVATLPHHRVPLGPLLAQRSDELGFLRR